MYYESIFHDETSNNNRKLSIHMIILVIDGQR